MSASDEAKTNNTWLRGHSDASALTFITSQPMASLQFRDYHDGEWKYVGYRPNALVLNIGDRFEFLTGGWAKSTIHRVVSPPKDQRGHRRLGLSAPLALPFVAFPSLTLTLDSLLLRHQALGVHRPRHPPVA